MFRTRQSTPRLSGIRLLGGALAFLLLCGTALLGGTQQTKTASTGLWHAGTKAPLIDVVAYPKDCQRCGESRWRFSGEGDEPTDQPFALDAFPQPSLYDAKHSIAAPPKRAVLIAFSHYRPQAPRAPPLV